jgi:hypothetical protein
MKTVTERTMVYADLYRTGVMIVFDDGKTAVFSASFLYDSLPHAEAIHVASEDLKEV